MRARRLRNALALGAGAYLSSLAVFAAAQLAQAFPAPGRPAPRVFVGSRVLAPHEQLGSWLELRRQELAQRPATLVHGMQSFESTLGELGVEIDVTRTMTAALEPGRRGELSARVRELQSARRGEIDIPLQFHVDERKANDALARIAPAVHRDPIDARLDLNEHARIEEIAGQELDVAATIASIERGTSEGRHVFAIVTKRVAARVTAEALSNVDISRVVASYETKFSVRGEGAGRAVNIATASRAVDGAVLMPGQSFAFNAAVGPRTRLRGFTDAPEIIGDELQPGVGGGVCQVASTLYAAALFGVLEIQERWAHARPSAYTKLGLDATVSYPFKDLRFRNALGYPVLLHVFVPTQGVVRAEVLGGDPVAKVEYFSGVIKSESFVRRVTRKPFLGSGHAFRHQKGIKGFSVSSLVRTTFPDGRVEERSYGSEYRPTPEVFWVSEDYDVSSLPPLPEGSSGVEGQQLASASSEPSG